MEEYRNYYLRLCYADWFYEYSDDHRVYCKGRDEVNELRREYHGDELKEKMFTEFNSWKNLRRETKPLMKEFGIDEDE